MLCLKNDKIVTEIYLLKSLRTKKDKKVTHICGLVTYIVVTYFHGQNVEKHKKDKLVTLSSPKFVSFLFPEDSEFLKFYWQYCILSINWQQKRVLS